MNFDTTAFINGIDLYGEWTPEEGKLLVALSTKIVRQNGWVPDEALHPHHQAVNHYACELVILRNNDSEIFLAVYDGIRIPEWHGLWHIPGGYTKPDEDLADTCDRIAKTEIGCLVHPARIIEVEKWPKGVHKWGGRPISGYTLCFAPNLKEDGKHRFFPGTALPENMVPQHREFILRQMGLVER